MNYFKRKLIISFICFALFHQLNYSQSLGENEKTFMSFQETIYIHQNTTFLLPQEKLLYKVYCINPVTNEFSDISKIAYIELIDINQKTIFKHKIQLKSGIGYGDFDLPISIKSGNYKLIGYTQWMRNNQRDHFFASDISIINPTLPNQSAMISIDTTLISNPKGHASIVINKVTRPNTSTHFSILSDKKSYNKREKINLSIDHVTEDLFGNYSISIRKSNDLPIPHRQSFQHQKVFTNNKYLENNLDSILYLPELRGELISGKIEGLKNQTRLSGVHLALSISGKQTVFKISVTNEDGIFFFNIPEYHENNNAILQIVNHPKDDYKIILDKPKSIDYSNVTYYNFQLAPYMKEQLLEKYINAQIENVYVDVKKHMESITDTIQLRLNSVGKEYYLDDYNRFPSLEETTIEILPNVIIKSNNGNKSLHLKLNNQLFASNLSPLTLIDGIMIQDQNELLDLNMTYVKKINVIETKYMYGTKMFDGVISFETFGKNYETNLNDNYKTQLTFQPLIPLKKYINQEYSEASLKNRIPDHRYQLYWNPDFTINSKDTKINLYASDISGEYEVIIEGFTNQGIPISQSYSFSVN